MIHSMGRPSVSVSQQNTDGMQGPQEASGFQGRAVSRVMADIGPHCAPEPWLPVQALPECEPAVPWFERRMPAPKDDIGPRLLQDPWLRSCWPDPARGRSFYDQQLAARLEKKQAGEQAGEEYRFAPFLVTLGNMRQLTAHILADQHFHEELDPDERGAFVELQRLIDQMIELQAPYKRTVHLAVLMTLVLDIVSSRHVIQGLRDIEPDLWKHHRIAEFRWYKGRDGHGRDMLWPAGRIPLETVLSCRWGGLLPGGLDEKQQLFQPGDFIVRCLSHWLDDERLLVCPSFEALDPEDFCRFGHLPVYPLGMMTRFALNADGQMMTPMQFMEHDAFHTDDAGIWRHLESDRLLEPINSRLLFRQLVLDSLAGQAPGWLRAVVLLVFQLFHEHSASEARSLLHHRSFLPLLHIVNRIRRELHQDYPLIYQKISGIQALQASCWVHWLYHQLRHQQRDLVPAMGPALLERFTDEVWPAFSQHWSFFETHQQQVSAWFVARAEARGLVRTNDKVGHDYGYVSRNWHASVLVEGILFFRQAWNTDSEGPVDHTDLAYFEAIEHPDEYRQLGLGLGEELPPWPQAGLQLAPGP